MNLENIRTGATEYAASSKIRSSKWNAFFLTGDEVEEYLADGIHIQDSGFFSKFSKERREDNTRRETRSNLLVRQRIVSISNEYLRRNTVPLEKAIVSAIVEPTKNIFNRKVSYVVSSSSTNDDSFQQKMRELIEKEKKESGDIVACFPIVDDGRSGKVLFITTNGICIVELREGNARLNLFGAMGYTLGPIGYGLGHLAGMAIHKYKMNNIQQKLLGLATTYSPSLLAQCFPGSQCVSYEMINILTYFDEKKGSENNVISLFYANAKQEFLKVTHDVMLEIIKILSGDNSPKSESTALEQAETMVSAQAQSHETSRLAVAEHNGVKRCGNCGVKCMEDARFCSLCGQSTL